MKKSVLIAAALAALVLGGCAHHQERHGRYLPPLDKRITPQVNVVDGKINAPFVLYFFSREKNVSITWQLPKDSKYRFPENGIVIEGALTEQVLRQPREGLAAAVPLDTRQTEIECQKQKGGLQFTCLNKNSKPGIYKYTIRVVDEKGKVLERDPYIMNDF